MTTNRVLSLFSGIGGLCHYGIKIAKIEGYQVTQFVEISPYSQSQLRKFKVPIQGDINTYDCKPGQYEIICGGFPCHGTSGAGNREGLEDSRSGLWREMFRIVKKCRPKFALVENPIGLLRRGLIEVLQDFDSIGYDAEWESILASEVGLPHKRDRLFIIAYPNGLQFDFGKAAWSDQIGDNASEIRESTKIRSYQPGVLKVGNGIPVGVAKGVKGNYDARCAYGLSCSPRQSAIAWKRIDYLNKQLLAMSGSEL